MVLTKMSFLVWLGFFVSLVLTNKTFFSFSGNLFLVLIRFLKLMIYFRGYWGSKDFKVYIILWILSVLYCMRHNAVGILQFS